jgi:Tfp pilus assembly protein PilF
VLSFVPEPIDPDLVVAQLQRIVTNPPLESSPSLCRFLRYVVEETLAGRTGSLKEYSLGVVVFERGEAFDPRLDPIVRVQARNLRMRLAQYYAGLGASDSLLIELPKRTYVPVFQSRASGVPVAPPEIPADIESPAIEERAGPPAAARAFPPRTVLIAIAIFTLLGTGALTWVLRAPDQAVTIAHQPDAAAQDLYIRGRYLMDRLSESSLRQSVASFQQAIARDPSFAAAHAGMAMGYNILEQYGFMPPGEAMEQARRSAQRALDIDPTLADGHVALAGVMEAYDWNWTAAEREYRRALELNSHSAVAHLWYGSFLRDQGRLDQALAELRQAAQLDPHSLMTTLNLGVAYKTAGDNQAAEEQARHAIELAPQLTSGHILLAAVYRAENKMEQADAELDRAREHADGNPHALAVLASAYAWRGKQPLGAELFRQLEEIAKRRYVSPFDLGAVSLGLGEDEKALQLLEEAYRQRSSGLIFLRDHHFSGPLSTQFDSLIARMHFAG